MRLKRIYIILLLFSCACLQACKDYLDLVPDNVPTLENAFRNRIEAEKYLYTCYSYLPSHHTANGNVGLLGADEFWTPTFSTYDPWQIAKGFQNVNDPYMNFWEGTRGASALYKGIRDCNIFLENVSNRENVIDLNEAMRRRWLGEVMFLKAYYHFYLFRMYGPIVIADNNLAITAPRDDFKQKRAPVDSVVNYISRLLDSAAVNLPGEITDRTTELGRVTRPAALSLKAKVLVTAASPLFNGNPDYVNFRDKDGTHLFNPAYSAAKWELAAEACKEAIEMCEENGARLYSFATFYNLNDTTKRQMSIRNSVSERWNSELIWGLSGRQVSDLQGDLLARIDQRYPTNIWGPRERLTPTLEIANLFYSDRGIPINEDPNWKYSTRYSIATASRKDRFNIIEGYETARFNFDREPRYYANIAFDGGIWYMENGNGDKSDVNTFTVRAKKGQAQAQVGAYNYSVTGLWAKKLVNWKLVVTESSYRTETFPWPEIRLADLYLLYAEALNEAGRGDEAILWIDKVRERAGLQGVKYSWSNYSTNKNKFASKAGLRDIIQQERGIELAFEGHRFWDLRRWKIADRVLNQGIHGWNIDQEGAVGYYRPRLLFTQQFVAPRDYLWPLRQLDLSINTNLVQNPGW
ncbi:RagB/SusD family nutrient uptake outer membrane protein [Desertivirga arenae]|uniref:RagB/SusD family nutrient uptake outer membrane protein n=1 Tax=Desertivirga arenae TaxID=2810309 RepID=UPI001A95FECB|nr:RagB/SusD family nutrient uptake outer membrane protein [Pedobacter sp. SYSU D00823]